MSTIASNLSEAQLAAIAAIVNGGEAANDAHDEPAKPVSKKTGFILIRALGNEVSDDTVVPVKHGSDEVAYWDDGTPITFGDLRFVVPGGATRADGTACNDYPHVWQLSQDAAYAAIQIANSAKPKKREFQPKAGSKSAAQPKADDARIERLEALVLQLAEGQFKQPAKPEPATGHRKVAAKPAKPVYNPGDVITVLVNGEAVELQITEDAKRLRKTVV